MGGCGRHEAITQKGSIGKIAQWANQPARYATHCTVDHKCALKELWSAQQCAVVAYFTQDKDRGMSSGATAWQATPSYQYKCTTTTTTCTTTSTTTSTTTNYNHQGSMTSLAGDTKLPVLGHKCTTTTTTTTTI